MNRKLFANDWAHVLKEEFSKSYYLTLREFLKKEYFTKEIYPLMHDIYNAFHLTPFSKVKAVILGQDPYHGPGQAHGLSFSVQRNVPIPPSLRNIYKELHNDLNIEPPQHGHLIDWAKQGVFLLNTVLTVRKGQAFSHQNMGWENFTNQVIKQLNSKELPIVYILWGRAAQEKINLIDTNKHYIIKAPHPSPLSAYRGFFDSQPFSKTNAILRETRQAEIDWTLSD